MIPAVFLFEALSDGHGLAAFVCGDDALDGSFRTQVTQDIRCRITNCFVIVETTLPAVRIGRLAVDRRFQRRGLGELMPMNAVHRTMQDAAAAFALLVDAKNDQAVAFYQRYGFQPISGKPRTLFLPLATAQKTLLGKTTR